MRIMTLAKHPKLISTFRVPFQKRLQKFSFRFTPNCESPMAISKEHLMRTRGFTLIELLVVVAIIALLIAILLPSLGKARENARIAVCGTHLRNIAQANLMYIDQNNNAMITAQYDIVAGAAVSQFWATDLAVQGYLPSKNNISPSGTTPIPSLSTIFACPDGLLNENVIGGGGAISFTGGFPRSDYNRYYVRQ